MASDTMPDLCICHFNAVQAVLRRLSVSRHILSLNVFQWKLCYIVLKTTLLYIQFSTHWKQVLIGMDCTTYIHIYAYVCKLYSAYACI